mgnify:CR=1 FL=1
MNAMASRSTGTPPFVLSERWADARGRLDPRGIFNVTTSTDVIGGNSALTIRRSRKRDLSGCAGYKIRYFDGIAYRIDIGIRGLH